MSAVPDFLFIGTAKAGTTSIAEYLLQHPSIAIPRKETFYFMRDVYEHNHLEYPAQRKSTEYILDAAEFHRLYPEEGKKLYGEVGTGYLYHHAVAVPRILETCGKDIPLIAILRDPVDRCYSSYRHFTKDMHETLSFSESLAAEQTRIDSDWDFMWSHRTMGLYADQLGPYLENFTKVKILLYEDLKRNPATVMGEIFEFLGLSPLTTLDTSKSHNASGRPKSEMLQKMITQESGFKKMFRPMFRAVFGPQLRSRIRKGVKNRNLTAGEHIPADVRQELCEYYKPNIRRLEGLIDRDLSHWAVMSEEKR